MFYVGKARLGSEYPGTTREPVFTIFCSTRAAGLVGRIFFSPKTY